MNPYLYYAPAAIAGVSGLILCCVAIRGGRPVLGVCAAVAGASAWLFYAIMEGGLRPPSEPRWLGAVIGLFSLFGPGVLFGGVMAAVALSKHEGRKTALLLWVAAVGLIASILHSMACWHWAEALGSC